MLSFKKFFPGGVHPKEARNGKSVTSLIPISKMPDPETVVIPMAQHLGTPSTCLVKKGDLVLKGQLIGEAQGYISANVHASVSGKVLAVDRSLIANGTYATAVTIENDKQHTWVPLNPCKDTNGLTVEDFLSRIKDAGIVGLGGAAFPTHVKLSPKEKIDTLVINGAECEPYLSADYRLMIESADTIIDGILLVKNILNIDRVIIGIEDNKPQAIEIFRDKFKNYKNIEVKKLATMYPQGGEKQLIYACTRRKVRFGSLPANIGVLVLNVGTCFSISNAIRTGKPLISRVVTVAGSVNTPKNLDVLIGTSVNDMLEECGGLMQDTEMLISGGPMMGLPLSTDAVPIMKGGSGVVALEYSDNDEEESPCIQCGRCNQACPMLLSPSEIDKNVRINKGEQNELLSVMNCIECGICSWVCPAKRRLTHSCKISKYLVREEIKRRGGN